MPLSEHLPPKYLMCTHPRGNPQPTALQVSAKAGSEAHFFARIRFWLWAALPACAEPGFPVLSCREGDERHGESSEAEGSNTAPCLQHYPYFPPLCIPNPLLSNYYFSPLSLHFCCLPLLLPVSPLPPAMAQAALWYSPSMLISGSDYTDGFHYGGSVGGREGNPTAPRLGFSKELSF